MSFKIFAPAFLVGAAAAAIVSAPAAAASTADCDDRGPASVCTRNGHSAIYAEPRQTGANLMMAPGMPFGFGTLPVMAID